MRATCNSLEITLTLNADEALWLKAMTQNAVGPENSRDYKIRADIFDGLPDFELLNREVARNATV